MDTNLSKKGESFKRRKESLWLNIRLYWKLAVLFMFLVAVSSAFFSYYFFRQISKELVVEEGGSISEVETVKKERIGKVLEYFAARKLKSSQILSTPRIIIDPSL